MQLSRRGFIAGLLASAAVAPLVANAAAAEGFTVGFWPKPAPTALPVGPADGWYDVFVMNIDGAEQIVTVPRHIARHERPNGVYLGTLQPDWVRQLAQAERDLQAA